MKRYILSVTAVVLLAMLLVPLSAAHAEEGEKQTVTLKAHIELGFLSVLDHRIKYSPSESYFNYRDNGGQDVLFFNSRYSFDLTIFQRHTVVFLYQPIELRTKVRLNRDRVIDGVVFPAGTGLGLLYGFPFYRLSYLYNFFPGGRHELSIGTSMQIRNATVEFESTDGTRVVSNRSVGPVPLIKIRGRYGFDSGFFLGAEMDGMYAPVSYINGSDNETVGAIIDLSFRAGVVLSRHLEMFFNVRYIAGGASNEDPEDYAKNWLHFMTVTLGASAML